LHPVAPGPQNRKIPILFNSLKKVSSSAIHLRASILIGKPIPEQSQDKRYGLQKFTG
jgi:hypothetical protein